MKITVKLRDSRTNTEVIFEGEATLKGTTANVGELLWDTERRINENGDIRAHITASDDEVPNGTATDEVKSRQGRSKVR